MFRKIIFLTVILLNCLYLLPSYALRKELTKYEIVEAASKALVEDGFDLSDVEVIYDQNNKRWREKVNLMTDLINSPNFKLFERGFMKNYRAILYNFKNPSGEVWVFVDKDTGEVLEIYRPEFVVEKRKHGLSPVFY